MKFKLRSIKNGRGLLFSWSSDPNTWNHIKVGITRQNNMRLDTRHQRTSWRNNKTRRYADAYSLSLSKWSGTKGKPNEGSFRCGIILFAQTKKRHNFQKRGGGS